LERGAKGGEGGKKACKRTALKAEGKGGKSKRREGGKN